jgi:hypothetical protein
MKLRACAAVAATLVTATVVALDTQYETADAPCGPWACGWRYPYKPVRSYFAPPGCYHRYYVTTPWGVEWRVDYICR